MMNRRPIGVLPFFFALALTGCNNDNVPAGYIGFEKGTAEWVYDKSKTTEEFSLKIVTGTKAGEDIPLVIESPNKSIVKLKTPAPQIPKGKKETTLVFELYSSKIEKRVRFINITCAPKEHPNQIHKISIHLKSRM
ncbi:hypothetical protein [uncultured Bacteroides sp.]|jgi:hypothetical protein|uniref:hypothetical protein n=1 Tax=Phocaeicola coprophilus TaxID=387090 RepID=UPI00280BF902|nr:hypothetical protein [uncultured Bacteroides sp.]